MNKDLIYVYCITGNPPQHDQVEELWDLKYIGVDGFYATIKYVSESEFSEENLKKNLSDISWVETNAREHIKVISRIMENSTVIPFKFGTIYNSEEGLRKFIRDYSSSLSKNLKSIEGKEEWSVKIYCNYKTLIENTEELSEDVVAIEKQIGESSPGKAYILQRKKDEVIKGEIEKLYKFYSQQFFDELKSLSESYLINNLLPKELTEKIDDMILNVTFFVSKNKVRDFISTTELQMNKNKIYGVTVEATGPWPPFSFISINEK